MAELLSKATDSRGNDYLHSLRPTVKPYFKDGLGSKSIGEPEWRPHPRNALSVPNRLDNSVRGGNGLDWFSSIRCAPHEENTHIASQERQKEAVCHLDTTSDRAPQSLFNETEQKSTRHLQPPIEYDTYDDFQKNYMKRPLEMSLRMSVGAKKKVFDKRNGIPAASLGDKSYQVPEYSMEFHKQGSTRPVISFGGLVQYIPDTFVPLQDLPPHPRVPFEEKEKVKVKRQEIEDVKDLDNWQPADPLIPTMQM